MYERGIKEGNNQFVWKVRFSKWIILNFSNTMHMVYIIPLAYKQMKTKQYSLLW